MIVLPSRIALLALAIACGLAGRAHAGALKVGSFVKSGATGAQVVAHGLGTTPRALILWTDGRTNQSVGADVSFAFGVSDGSTSRALATASQSDVGRSNASRRIANKALTLVQWGEQVTAEADLTSWNDTTLTLDWTTNDGVAAVVHYLVVGGNGVSAKVVAWQLNATAGTQSVATVGFQPDVVIHAHAGSDFTAASPATRASSAFGLGVMDADGRQWANTHLTADNAQRSDTQRHQRTDRTLLAIDTAAGLARDATFFAMLANGFAVTLPAAGNVTQMVSLALRGVRVQAGSMDKVTGAAPIDQVVGGMSFRPAAVLFSSVQDTAENAPAMHARFGLGGADGSSQGAVAFQDADGLNKTSVDAVDRTTAFVKLDNDAGVVDAEADLGSLDPSGFTLRWTTNDALATQLVYLALAPRQRVWIH